MEWDAFCCLQQRYSYFEPVQGADFGNQMVLTPELMELCNKLKIGIMAYSPLLGGFYSSKGKELPFQYKSKTNELKFSRLQELSAKMNIKENALVLAWMIHHSPPVIPVSAAGSVTQLKENLESLNIRLSTDQVDYLNLKTRVPD
jgi:aryl-alcohol dehydrogenase-like predicted oxidoreductase